MKQLTYTCINKEIYILRAERDHPNKRLLISRYSLPSYNELAINIMIKPTDKHANITLDLHASQVHTTKTIINPV